MKSHGINLSPKNYANNRLEKICLLSTLQRKENPVQVKNRQGSSGGELNGRAQVPNH